MEPYFKNRRLRLAQGVAGEALEKVRAGLSALPGVVHVAVHPPDRLLVEYDLMQVKLRAIEGALVRMGHPLAMGLLGRIWRSWLGFTEDNVQDNLSDPPVAVCCANRKVTDDDKCAACAARWSYQGTHR